MGLSQLLEVIPPDAADEIALAQSIDYASLPRHVAVIMDGNGRWAKLQHKRRIEGHRAGTASVREIVETAARTGVSFLTLYAFSVENWKRPAAEVSALMALLKNYLESELHSLVESNIRLQVIGRLHELAPDVQEGLRRAMEKTRSCNGLLLSVALNYGGRTEIVDAVRRLVTDAAIAARAPATIDETTFASYLYTAGQPDPDLLIRTSGELRVSNFLLWQIAYAEIWVTETLWPDFRRRHFLEAIAGYQKRERRYGGIEAAPSPLRTLRP
jgi:undecaprenyl diphosphate synthase